jgi:hypothetical protein
LKKEQGEVDMESGNLYGISHEALNALSEGQIFSLMTSSSLNYDIIHQLMQLKRQPDYTDTARKLMLPADTSQHGNTRPSEVPMDTSDTSTSASQRAHPSPADSLPPLAHTSDMAALVGKFSTLDAQGKQSMVDYLVQSIVAQSGATGEGQNAELNEVLKNMILVLQQQIQTTKGVDFQQLQLQAKQLTDQQIQNILSPKTDLATSDNKQPEEQPLNNDATVKDGEGGDGPLENQEPVKEVVNEPQCVNEGCSNPPVDSEDRGPLFCSNECLVLHCRDMFTKWVREKKLRAK